jgi:hypothetical protein
LIIKLNENDPGCPQIATQISPTAAIQAAKPSVTVGAEIGNIAFVEHIEP